MVVFHGDFYHVRIRKETPKRLIQDFREGRTWIYPSPSMQSWYKMILVFVGITDPNLSELRRFRAASLPRRKQRRLRRRDAKIVPWP